MTHSSSQHEVARHWRVPPPDAVLAAVGQCAREIAAVRDRDVVLAAIVKRARRVLASDMAYLSLNDLPRGDTYIHVTDGVETEAYRTIRMPLGVGVLGAIAAGDDHFSTAEYLSDPEITHLADIDRRVRSEGVRAILGSPLRVGGRVVGALLIANRARTTAPDRRVVDALGHFAAHAALALELARRAEQLDALEQSSDRVLEAQVAGLHRLLRLDDRLTGAVAEAGGPEAIVAVLTATLQREIGLYDASGRLRAGRPVLGPALDLERLGPALRSSAAAGRAAVLDPGDATPGAIIAVETANGGRHSLAAASADAEDRAVIERGAVHLRTSLLVEEMVADAESRQQTSILTDLLAHGPGREPAALDGELRSFGIGPGADVVTIVAGSPAPMRQLAIAVARELWPGPGSIIAPHAGHTCIVLAVDGRFADEAPETRMLQAGRLLLDALEARGVRAVIGLGHRVGQEAPGAAGIAAAHRLADRVQAAAVALGWTSGYATRSRLGLAGTLLSGASPGAVEEVIAEALGPVQEYDRARGSELEATLLATVETASAAEAAARLHIHPSTVRQRLERVDRLLGADWRTPARRADIHFALRASLLRSSGLI